MKFLDAMAKACNTGWIRSKSCQHAKVNIRVILGKQNNIIFFDEDGKKLNHSSIGKFIEVDDEHWYYERENKIYNLKEAMKECENNKSIVFITKETDRIVHFKMKYDEVSNKVAVFLSFEYNEMLGNENDDYIRKYILPDERIPLIGLHWRVKK